MLKTIVIFSLTILFPSAGEPSVSLGWIDDITNVTVIEKTKTSQMDTILISFGTVIGILLVIAVIVVILTNRKQDHTSQSHYEERDMRTDENHRYGNTRDRSVYYNSQEEVKIDVINTGYDYCSTEGMLERYDVSELKNDLEKKDFLQPRLTAEFEMLTSPIQEYDYIESDIQRDFGRPHDNTIITIQLLTFKLYNKSTKSSIQIEIHKSSNSKYTDKYPSVDVLSYLVDKVSDRSGNVLLLGSKSFGLRISGVLYVCLDVAKAMKKEGIFNLLESAITAKRNISSVFHDFDEYEMCYRVTEYYLEHYLHHVHTYDHID
ncbi:Hypothetical predicted protein [Mytilus galloprovincialis]|uniref:Tyrosine-protein phosphatase domain-containing protein n=1 Tax=Mytilus galloprovincialis TaxID=29158 RepID=A0A8B6FAZ5_MYTGA|nr:Hypothetical predicted protein [Mytilus galloprovincialis]